MGRNSEWSHLARAFLAWLERGGEEATEDALVEWLDRLQEAGRRSSLPDLEGVEDIDVSDPAFAGRARHWLLCAAAAFPDLGPGGWHDDGFAFDDISDIACDLERALRLLEAGHPELADWEWAFNFQIHWGQHADNLHRLLMRRRRHPRPPISPPSASR